MPERSKASIRVKMPVAAQGTFCTNLYGLDGPQVDPESSYWLDCGIVGNCPVPRPITIGELQSKFPAGKFRPYPTDPAILKAEIEELIMLARIRDEPGSLAHEPGIDPKTGKPFLITQEPLQLRLPLSMFLQLRPQPLGAVINTARGDAFPVINTGRELARYFEAETPGTQFRHALNYMVREEEWSPPRQAWIWAALDITIYSALGAAWYIKWRGKPGVEYRARPWECYKDLDVLFDRVTNSTNSADGARRGFPMGVQPLMSRPGELVTPEAAVPDIVPMTVPPSQPTPGTPRHPAYPSGHSTYSAAAARLLIEFFPRYREQLCRLADNTGLARLWAGVHWRTDHTFGQEVGTKVAQLIIEQLMGTGIARFPAPRPGDEKHPKPGTVQNTCKPGKNWSAPPLPQPGPCAESPEIPDIV